MDSKLRRLFRKATDGNKVVNRDWMTPSQLRPLLRGYPEEIWLDHHRELHGLRRDPPAPYSHLEFLGKKVAELRREWLRRNAPGAVRVCRKSYHVRYPTKLKETLRLMHEDRVDVIARPALWWAPAQVYGAPDLLVRTTWLAKKFPGLFAQIRNKAGQEVPDAYVLFDFRFGRWDDTGAAEKRAPDLPAQMRLNTFMLGKLQSWMPPLSFLVTRYQPQRPFAIAIRSRLNGPLDADLVRLREQFLDLKRSEEPPWTRPGFALRLDEGGGKWSEARQHISWEVIEGGDPAALPHVGVREKERLSTLGYATLDDLLDSDPESIPLSDVEGFGPVRIKKLRAVLQANRTGIPVLPEAEYVPGAKEFEFFVDFEYFNNQNVDIRKQWPQLGGKVMIFMIGIGWNPGDGWQFESLEAGKETLEDERQLLTAFEEWLDARTDGAFIDPDRTALYHWAPAEPSQIRGAAKRLKLPANHRLSKLPWVDLRKQFGYTSCAVPGAWDFGLKSVAKALARLDQRYDPGWVGDLDDGLGAMVLGWQAYAKSRPGKSAEMKILRQYLEADCKAVSTVLRWMREGGPALKFGAPSQRYVSWDEVHKGFRTTTPVEAYAGFNNGKGVVVYRQPVLGKRKGIQAIQHLIWGDWLKVVAEHEDWRKIESRGTHGWVHKRFIQQERLVEVNFVDVGQGDGCFIVLPGEDDAAKDRFLLVDAGEGDNMFRFLHWRFRHFRKKIQFESAIITHPDKDHYAGFRSFFDEKDSVVQNVTFNKIYHNGIIERGSGKLGEIREEDGRKTHLAEVVTDQPSLEEIVGAGKGGGLYLKLLRRALASGRVESIEMAAAASYGIAYLQGFESDKKVSIEVLAPVPESIDGKPHLRWFGNPGKTKNGHSIVLRMIYKNVSILLGGDLNTEAEHYLLDHYSKSVEAPPETGGTQGRTRLEELPRQIFEADVAKACHHGSADFTTKFLRAVNAAAVVVSSGDQEPHCHPRPEALGAFGRYGRGELPLIYSTELARSTEEKIKHPALLLRQLDEARSEKREREFIDELLVKLGRSVAVYGMIAVRTDGKKVLMAQKLERARSKGQKWDLHVLRLDESDRSGKLAFGHE